MFKKKIIHREKLVVGLVLVAALTVRLWGINFGLPHFFFHSDENLYIGYILSLITPQEENLSFRWDFPSVFYYLLALEAWGYFMSGRLLGFYQSLTDLSLPTLYLIFRATSAVLSTGVVYLTYRIGKILYDRTVGLIAAGFIAFSFVDVLISHYIKHDVYAQFFGILSFFFSCLGFKTGKARYYLYSGFFIGIAAAIKINSLLFVVPLIFGFLLSQKSVFKRHLNPLKMVKFPLIVALIAIIIGMLISGSPYLDFKEVIHRTSPFSVMYRGENSQYFAGDKNGIPNALWWPLYLATSGLFYPFFFLALSGIIWAVRSHGKRELLLLSFPFAYYLVLIRYPVRFDRWAANLTPFFAILASVVIQKLFQSASRRRNRTLVSRLNMAYLVIVLAFGISAVRIFLLDFAISQKDTREQAGEWILSNIPKDQIIFVEGRSLSTGHYLQEKGFHEIINPIPFGNQELFLYGEEIFLLSDTDYYMSKNYQNVNNFDKIFDTYQLMIEKGELIKEFSNPLFALKLFNLPILLPSSTVDYYHQNTVRAYKIPIINPNSEVVVNYDYLPEKMNHNQYLVEVDNLHYISKLAGEELEISGPHLLFPKGDYLLEYKINNPQCKLNSALLTISVTSSGQTDWFAANNYSCQDILRNQNLTLLFRLTRPARLEFLLRSGKEMSFLVEKAIVKRI